MTIPISFNRKLGLQIYLPDIAMFSWQMKAPPYLPRTCCLLEKKGRGLSIIFVFPSLMLT